MKFDEEGHLLVTPKEFNESLRDNRHRLANYEMLHATPSIFKTRTAFCDFIEAISVRLAIHPRNIFVRGSCLLGFSVSPNEKVWSPVRDGSDIDLAIADFDYFTKVDSEIRAWESFQGIENLRERELDRYARRQSTRQYYYYSEYDFPTVVCKHHKDVMHEFPTQDFCDTERPMSAFVFRDWWAARSKYTYDLEVLGRQLQANRLPLGGPAPATISTMSVPASSGVETPAEQKQ